MDKVKITKRILNGIIYLFAIIGFILVVGYVAVKFGWTNTSGIIDNQTASFIKSGEEALKNKDSSDTNQDTTLINQSEQEADIKNASTIEATNQINKYAWNQGEEWEVLKAAIRNDAKDIKKAAAASGVSSRLIVSNLIVEQLRLYHTDRELFKQAFAPLKILGNQSQFSWGIMGIKPDTAMEIEEHLKSPLSQFYLGTKYEHALDFKTSDPDQERFDRLVNEEDHYGSYLYAGFALKQIDSQWKKAGFDISKRPEILSTLYNIGFIHSKPNKNPQVGGAEIEIKGKTYSFGGLAYEFYNSNELIAEFPR